MLHSYCTLFDSKYLSRGLALHESLISVGASFHLYILAMDNEARETLQTIKLPHVSVISLEEFEDPDLLAVKNTRSRQEYCWTCTPSIIRYCLNTFNLAECTYLDADLFFFADPGILLSELGEKSVLITEHRYFPDFDQSETSGKYCVQFMTFRNNQDGRDVLEWWRNACNEWCFARHENGKFGDQKYLDDWAERYEQVQVLSHHGGGVAAWNVQSYDILKEDGKIVVREINTGKFWDLVFYHFHDFYFDSSGGWFHSGGLKGYGIGRDAYILIYARYLRTLFGLQFGLPAGSMSDFPRMPDALSKRELLLMLIPALSRVEARDKLRGAYTLTDGVFRLGKNLDANRLIVLFEILLEAGYKLDQNTLWNQHGNYTYELIQSVRNDPPSILRRIRNKLRTILRS